MTVGSLGVDEDDSGSTLNEPSTVDDADSSVPHGLHSGGDLWVCGFHLFHLDGSLLLSVDAGQKKEEGRVRSRTHRLVVEGTDESVAISIFGCCDRSFRLDDGVDATNYTRENGSAQRR